MHNAELAQRLQLWWQTAASARPLPPQLAALRSPEPRSVTSAVPGANLKGAKMLKELFLMGLLAAVTAVLFGLRFHLMAFLMSSTYSRMGLSPFHSPGTGWYAVTVSVLVRGLIVIPLLRHKDQPVLIAQGPAGKPEPLPVDSAPNPVAAV